MGLHWQELVIILVLALIIFGPKRLPEIGRSLGKGLREFKSSVSGPANDVRGAIEGAVPADGERATVKVEADNGDGATTSVER